MPETGDLLARIQARSFLEDINHYILHQEGEIVEVPGKISLIWTDPITNLKRFLSVKAAGDDQVLVNGRLYPATEQELKQALRACLASQR